MAIASKRVEKLMEQARIAVTNALEQDEIKEKVLKFGYTDARLQEGYRLYEKLAEKYRDQQHKRGQQISVSEQLDDKLLEERDRYIEYRTLARRVFEEQEKEGDRKSLGLDGRARATLVGVIKEARQFYQGALANEEYMNRLATFSLSAEVLQAGLAGIEELEELDKEYEKCKGLAQQATVERDALYKEMYKWMGDFRYAARFALKETPQILETLKIKVYSEGYKKKKNANEETEQSEENPGQQEEAKEETG